MMALGTPQKQNPIAYENPQELVSEEQCYNQGLRATNMEKLRKIVIKLANSAPNKILSENQNSLIHDQFNQFLSVLHTPNHPPYAWMIQRALQELNEKGGSSEESIADFIRKEYHDLPWSHFTLLKHHLQALCECGDIILTHGQHYLLAGADSNVNSDKRHRRKSSRKKRDWDWKVKQGKQRKKDIDKERVLQKEDVHEEQNCMLEGPKQKNLEAEARNDRPALYIVGEDREQIEGDQNEISTPERPPGFESAALDEASHRPICCRGSPSQAKYPMRRPLDVVVSAAEGLSGHQEQIHVSAVYDQQLNHEDQMISSVHGTPETGVAQTFQEGQPMTTINGIDLQQTNTEELPAMPSQARPIELRSQKKPSESVLAKNTAAISETEPVNLTGARCATRIVFKYKKRPPANKAAKKKDLSSTIQEIKEEVLQQKQLKGQGEKHLNDNTTASSLLQQQMQEQWLSNTNEPQEVKSEAANRSKYQGCLRPRPPRSEQSSALNTAESSQSHSQHDVQQQHKRRGRPPRAKSDNGVTNDNVVSFPNPYQMQQPKKPKHKHHGRPPKCKPGASASTVTNEKLLSGTQRHKLRNLRSSRPRKAVEGE